MNATDLFDVQNSVLKYSALDTDSTTLNNALYTDIVRPVFVQRLSSKAFSTNPFRPILLD